MLVAENEPRVVWTLKRGLEQDAHAVDAELDGEPTLVRLQMSLGKSGFGMCSQQSGVVTQLTQRYVHSKTWM